MNEEFSDAEIQQMLGSYGDAFERHVTEVNSASPEGAITSISDSQAEAGAKGSNMLSTQPDGDVLAEVDPVDGVIPTPAENGGNRRKVLVGAFAVALALVIGGVYALASGPSEVDTSEVAEAPEEELDQASATVEPAPDDADTTPSVADNSSQGVAGVGFGGAGTAIFSNGEFVSTGQGIDGVVVSRSADGVNWSTEATVGLPENGTPTGLIEFGDGWAMLVQVFGEIDEAEPLSIFGADSNEYIATSTDLVNWELTELPADLTEGADTTFGTAIAASNDTIAVLLQVQPPSGDQEAIEILLDNGVIDATDLPKICSTEFSEGGSFTGQTCTGGDGEVDEVVELFTIAPGDPLYEDIAAAFDPSLDEFEFGTPIVVSGPADGPFESTELPATGIAVGMAGTTDGFVIGVSGAENEAQTVVLTSVDGVTWTEASELGATLSTSSITVTDDRLVAMTQAFGSDSEISVVTSDDFAETWVESSVPTELFGAWGQVVSGPAGVAVQLDGTAGSGVDGFDPFGGDPIELTQDGYTMMLSMTTGETSLIGPGGDVIYEAISLNSPDAELTAVRFEGPNEELLIWLDPETGEDLVTFSEENLEEQIGDIDSAFEEGLLEGRATEVWFSADGTTWSLVNSSQNTAGGDAFTSLVGVGDDEVVVRTETFTQPPAELLAPFEDGGTPTAEEEAALEEWQRGQSDSVVWESIPVG